MKTQKWVVATQYKTERSWTKVYLPALANDVEWLQVGDAPEAWKGEHPPLPEPQSPTPSTPKPPLQPYSPREYLELSREELLQRTIDKAQQDLEQMIWERDHPEEAAAKKAEEAAAKKATRANQTPGPNPKWYEFMPAIGGAWLKATTGPPGGDDPLHVLLVRDGKVMDVVKTTVKRFCHWKTPEYRGGARLGQAAWGIEATGHSSLHRVFSSEDTTLGDCYVLQIGSKDPSSLLDGSNYAKCREISPSHPHPGLVDLALVSKQRKLYAMQKVASNHYNDAYFDVLPVEKYKFQLGDQVWDGNPTPTTGPTGDWNAQRKKETQHRLTKSPEDTLKIRIEAMGKEIEKIISIRDVPGKREEHYEEERAKGPVQWDEASVAVGGAWVKACTMPPNGLQAVDLCLVRDGKILEICETKLHKMNRFWNLYDAQGAYCVSPMRVSTHQGAWGVHLEIMAANEVFEVEMSIGDCVVLRIAQCQCDDGELVG